VGKGVRGRRGAVLQGVRPTALIRFLARVLTPQVSFSKVIEMLFELGVPRAQFVAAEPWSMKTREEQQPEKK
jgi:hypothetical protein